MTLLNNCVLNAASELAGAILVYNIKICLVQEITVVSHMVVSFRNPLAV